MSAVEPARRLGVAVRRSWFVVLIALGAAGFPALLLPSVLRPAKAFATVAVGSIDFSGSTGTTLPFDDFADLVTDKVRDVAYITGGLRDGQVVAVNGTGSIQRTYRGLAYPTSIALSDDAQTLYVGEAQSHSIVAIDVQSDARTTYAIGDNNVEDLAVVGTKVWFSNYEQSTRQRAFGVLTPTTGTVTTGVGPTGLGVPQHIVADPHDRDTLYVMGSEVERLDITPTSSGDPQARVVAHHGFDASANEVLAVSPDGTQVITNHGVLRASDLTLVDKYPAQGPRAVAVRDDGTVALGGRSDDSYDLYVYGPGQTTFAERTDYDAHKTTDEYVVERGLGFGATTLFSVTSQQIDTGVGPLVVYASQPATPQDPVGTSQLDVPQIDGVVNDPTHHQSFIGTGVSGNGIVVVDDRGRVTRVLHHLPGVIQMALSGDTLWAAVSGMGDIVAVDTRTFGVRHYPVPDYYPRGIAVSSGLVWFTARSDEPGYAASIDALDPTTGTINQILSTDELYLAAGPGLPHALFAYGNYEGAAGGATTKFITRGGAQPQLRNAAHGRLGTYLQDAAFTRNLQYLAYAAPYGPTSSDAASTTNLTPTRTGRGRLRADAVAVRSDGLVATGLNDASAVSPASNVRLRQGVLGPKIPITALGPVVPRGLTFAGRDLLEVVSTGDGEFDIRRITMPLLMN